MYLRGTDNCLWEKDYMSQNSKYQEFGYREMKLTPWLVWPLYFPSLSFFPSCFNRTAVDRKKQGGRSLSPCLVEKTAWRWVLNGPSEARAVMRWVQCHGGTSHLETQSSCTRWEKKAQRMTESCIRDRVQPTTNYGLIKFDKNEEGVYIEGLYCNKRLTMHKHITYIILIYNVY